MHSFGDYQHLTVCLFIYLSVCFSVRLKVVKVTDQVPFSSSVVDANTTFLQVHIISHTVSSAVLYTGILVLLSSLQVIAFWKDLSWPDREQSYGWFVTVVKVRT